MGLRQKGGMNATYLNVAFDGQDSVYFELQTNSYGGDEASWLRWDRGGSKENGTVGQGGPKGKPGPGGTETVVVNAT